MAIRQQYLVMENELDTLDCESAANELDGSEEIALETSSEIIQSVLQSAKAQEHSLKEHGNLTYLRSYWLHEGKFSRKIAQAMVVRRHRDDSYKGTYIAVQFWKRKKLSESFKREQNIQFSMEETRKLLMYLREAAMTAESDENTYVLLPAAEIIDNLDDTQRQTFVNILTDLVRSRRVAELFTSGQLNDETIKHLAAAAQQVKYKAALSELSDMIEGITTKKKKDGKTQPLTEHSYQEWFEAHTWIFGTEYIHRIDIRDIDSHASVDFILETADGFFDVLELKTPGAEVLVYDKSHKTWYFSSDVAKVIAQAAKYLNAIERNADMIYRNSCSRIIRVSARR